MIAATACWRSKKNIEQDIDSSDDSIYIEAPSYLLREVIRNLLDNSAQHMRQPGTITISLLRVCDTGPGIPDAERSKVFDRFYRFDGGKPNSSGLGLAIVNEICESLQAQVTLPPLPEAGSGLQVDILFRLTFA